MDDQLIVLYTCTRCGITDRPVAVRYREAEEGVKAFFEGVVLLGVGNDHRATSPECRTTKIAEVKVPIPPGTCGIGERPET